MKPTERLISEYAGPALTATAPHTNLPNTQNWHDLVSLLSQKNGFYAFESSLYIRSLGHVDGAYDIIEWNRPELWKAHYKSDNFDRIVCFAENLFGEQFYFDDNGFGRMDPETGEIEWMGADLEAWIAALMADPGYHLAYTLGHAWQEANGPLKPGHRLAPKTPFATGGGFEVSNLYEIDSLQAMKFRGDLATQLHNVPDGSLVQFEL